MQKIRAAVCRQFGAPLTIEEITLAAPGPGEVEVTIDACAIGQSDISAADGAWGGPLPAVFGHEAAGRISALGEGTGGYVQGQHVLVTQMRACGGCTSCATGRPAYCETPPQRVPGPLSDEEAAVEQGFSCGAFAEKVVVHTSQIVPLPDDIPMDAACLLSCSVVSGIGAVVNTAQIRAGQDVVVIGVGGVGLNVIQGARIAGAARIIAVDMSEEKLETARAFGATAGILSSEAEPWQLARSLTAGRGADAVFVTTGAIPVYDSAPHYLATGGRIVMLGLPHAGAATRHEPAAFALRGQGVIGSRMGDAVLQRDIPWMLELYRQGRLKLDAQISGRYDLEEINDAIANTKGGQARRNVILFPG